MPHTEIDDCLRRLEALKARIAAIKALFVSGHVPAVNRERARSMMKELKEQLKAENKAVSTGRAQSQMSQVEQDYHRTIHEAYCHITVKWNSNPDHFWRRDLDEAEIDLDWSIGQFR